MTLSGAGSDFISLCMQAGGSLLFCLSFLFLWRRSGIIYFGLWGAAWAVETLGLFSMGQYLVYRSPFWLILYAFMEFAFAILLVAAARAGFSGSIRNWRAPLTILAAFPVVLAVILTFGSNSRFEAFHALHAVLLCAVYGYNYTSIRAVGTGAKVFRFSLLCLATAFLFHAVLFFYMFTSGSTPAWARYLRYNVFYAFALNALLAFAAMAMWIESLMDRVRELGTEIDRVRRESVRTMDLDRLTGLLNQSALATRMEDTEGFTGVVSVCDMDDFKEVNDRYGHLAGDEILRNIGHLLRTSIRQEDEAFRWGGDEFVILFHNENRAVAQRRMSEIETRLKDFRVRGHGMLPITFSWGTAEASGRPLREVLDEADREMYAFKRKRR